MRRRGLLVLAILIGITGCTRGAPPPRGTVGVTLEDGRISAAVRTVLLNDPELGLRRIAVEARMGVVTLSGVVRTLEEVQRAERLARSVAGVRELKSVLRIEP